MNSKSFLFFLAVILQSLFSSGQIKFVDGYVVMNNQNKVICQIRNAGQEESGLHFLYRMHEKSDIQKVELSKIKEFGIEGEMKYLRALIAVDVSPERIAWLKDTIPVWEEGHAYIQVLVESELAVLYAYYDHGRPLFYYSSGDSVMVPLVYKRYQLEVTPGVVQQTLYNHGYLDQLGHNFSCNGKEKLTSMPYTKKALVSYFINYNICRGVDYTVYGSAGVKKPVIRLKAGISANRMQLDVNEFADARPNVTFSGENSPGFGAELEYLLPFNKYKWSLFAETNFYSYQSDEVKITGAVSPESYEGYRFDYKTLEFPIGITYYSNLNEDHKLFVRGAFVPHMILKGSNITFNGIYFYDLSTSSRLMFGVGYQYRRLGLELRMYTNQNLTQNIEKRGSDLSQLSGRVSYVLFERGR